MNPGYPKDAHFFKLLKPARSRRLHHVGCIGPAAPIRTRTSGWTEAGPTNRQFRTSGPVPRNRHLGTVLPVGRFLYSIMTMSSSRTRE